MPSRTARNNTKRESALSVSSRPRRSRALPIWLYGSFALGLLILLACFFAGMPLGQGYFILRYSPLADVRLSRTLLVLPGGAMACGAVWALAHGDRRSHHVVGLGLLAVAMIGL